MTASDEAPLAGLSFATLVELQSHWEQEFESLLMVYNNCSTDFDLVEHKLREINDEFKRRSI